MQETHSSTNGKPSLKKAIRRKMTLIASTFFISLIILNNFTFYVQEEQKITIRLKKNLEEIATMMASEISAEEHKQIQSKDDINNPIYKKYFNQLLSQRKIFKNLTYAYTMRVNKDGKVVHVIDADDGEDGALPPGSIYDDADEEFTNLVATLSHPDSDNEFLTDKWGTWLSGYAPLIDKNGNLDGIVGVDMSATDVIELKHRILFSTILMTFGASILAFILSSILSAYFTRPIYQLINQMKRVADGDFSATIELPNKDDEIAILASSYNQMIEKLNQLFADLESELYKSRAIEQKMRQGEERLLQTFHLFNQPILVIEDNLVIDCNPSALTFFGAEDSLDIINNEIDLLTDNHATREIIDNAITNPENKNMLSFRMAKGKSVTHRFSINTLYINESYLQILIIHPNQAV